MKLSANTYLFFLLIGLVFTSCNKSESSDGPSGFNVSEMTLINTPTTGTMGMAVSESNIALIYRDASDVFHLEMRNLSGEKLWEQLYSEDNLGSGIYLESILYEGNNIFSLKARTRLIRFNSDGDILLDDNEFFTIPFVDPIYNGIKLRDDGGYILFGSALGRAWYSTWSQGGEQILNDYYEVGSQTQGFVTYTGCVDLGKEGFILGGTRLSISADEDHVVFINQINGEGEQTNLSEIPETNTLPDFGPGEEFNIRLTNMGRALFQLRDDNLIYFLNPQNVTAPFQEAKILRLESVGALQDVQELELRNRNFINGQFALDTGGALISQFGSSVIKAGDGTIVGAVNTEHPLADLSLVDNPSIGSAYLFSINQDGELSETISLQNTVASSISSIAELANGQLVLFGQVASVETSFKPVLIFL